MMPRAPKSLCASLVIAVTAAALAACGGSRAIPGGAADGGGAGNGGNGGSLDAGADGPPAGPRLGQACFGSGTLACNGTNQKQTLICQSGEWQAFEICDASQNCDTTDGVCTDIAPDCAAHDPGYAWCVGDQLSVCGPDRVTVVPTACTGLCVAGACQPDVCGDGKIEGAEECDDGDTVPGDGCEADCKLSRVIALTAGASHTCALLREGLVRCWGDNTDGQLGLGTAADLSGQPPYQNGLVPLGAAAVALTAGDSHTCALMADQSVRCWGANADGQLGLGNTDTIGDDEAPDATHAAVPLGAKATAVAASGNDTCAILQDGSLRCWGRNDYGQLGLGHTNTIGDNEVPSATVATVSLGDTAVAVAAGGDHTCAILGMASLGSSSVRCWGRNNVGQLGLGNTTEIGDDELPTAVAALAFRNGPFDAIVAGVTRTFLHLSNDYGVENWGDNSDGGLGAGTTEDFTMLPATQLGNLTFDDGLALEVSAGAYHACVRTQNQLFRCWGVNDKGQLGLGTTATLGDVEAVNLAPPVDLGTDAAGHGHYATLMATGAAHTCVRLETGTLVCWGENAAGQLGLGYTSQPPLDYVGGTPDTIPSKLPAVQVFPPAP